MAHLQFDHEAARKAVMAAIAAEEVSFGTQYGLLAGTPEQQLAYDEPCTAQITDRHDKSITHYQDVSRPADLCRLPIARFFEPFPGDFTHAA